MSDDLTVDNSVATQEVLVDDHPADDDGPIASSSSSNLARLVVKRSGAETDVEFPVNSPCIIGRFDPSIGPIDIDLGSLPEGSYVSRKHAKITFDDGVWKVTDMGSSNGTFILRQDFEKVDEAELKDGDEIALGNARFVFHEVPVTPAE